MKIWIVSREYSGLAEAGGVKQVACALAENLDSLGHQALLFIPLYGCTDLSNVEGFHKLDSSKNISVGSITEKVSFYTGSIRGVKVIFVSSKSYSSKHGIYTYSFQDQKKNPECKRGAPFINSTVIDVLFQKAVVAYAGLIQPDQMPDIVHCQDATTALVPALFKFSSDKKLFFDSTKFVVTIHNAGPGYHHEFKTIESARNLTDIPYDELRKALNGSSVEPFLLLTENTQLTTVSPEYACEIVSGQIDTGGLGKCLAEKNVPLIGITNGIQYERYDPTNISISQLPFTFNPEVLQLKGKYDCRADFIKRYATGKPKVKGLQFYGSIEQSPDHSEIYFAYHGRIVHQKGIDLLISAVESVLSSSTSLRFLIMGQGAPQFEEQFISLAKQFPGKILYIRGYSRSVSRQCVASSDFLLMPSLFEPCGLEDFIAQVYGTLPVAHATGGLKKIIDDETGFLYSENDSSHLSNLIKWLATIKISEPSIFNSMISYSSRYVHEVYSWKNVVKNQYIPLYENLQKN